MKLYLYLLGLLLFSCIENEKNVPDLANNFYKIHLSTKLKKNSNKFLVFILNPSECNPCEQEINSFLIHFRNKKTINIIPTGKNTTYKINGTFINIKRISLAKYGLLNANGSVLIIKQNKCVFYKSIDVQNIDQLIKSIDLFLKN